MHWNVDEFHLSDRLVSFLSIFTLFFTLWSLCYFFSSIGTPRSHLMIFRLHLIFRLSSIKSVCSSPECKDILSFHDLPFSFTDFLQRSSDSFKNYYKTLFSTLATCEIVQRIVFAAFERCDSVLSHILCGSFRSLCSNTFKLRRLILLIYLAFRIGLLLFNWFLSFFNSL
jgi:hypothetical protein